MLTPGLRLPTITLCFAQGIVTALIYHIFPFLAAYFLSLNVEPTYVSSLAGLGEGLAAFTELLTLSFHVWAINRFPHRWVSTLSILSCGSIAATFGLCSAPWQIMALRALMGVANIAQMLIEMMLGQVLDDASRAQGFAFLTAGAALGTTGSSAIGGYLASPEGRVPFFGEVHYFQRYPYTLPGTAMFVLAVVAALSITAFVPETNPRYLKAGGDETSDRGDDERRLTYRQMFSSPLLRQLVAINSANTLCFFGFLALMSTAGKLPTTMGGLGMEDWEIGQVFATTAIVNALNATFFYKPIERMISIRNVFRLAPLGWVLSGIFFPLASYFIATDSIGQNAVFLMWYAGGAGARMFWIARNILTVTLYPDPRDRTLAAGITRQSTNIAAVIGTTGHGYLFGYSSRHPTGSIGRQGIWVYAIGATLLLTLIASRQPEITEPDPITKRVGNDGESEMEADERTTLLGPNAAGHPRRSAPV